MKKLPDIKETQTLYIFRTFKRRYADIFASNTVSVIFKTREMRELPDFEMKLIYQFSTENSVLSDINIHHWQT